MNKPLAGRRPSASSLDNDDAAAIELSRVRVVRGGAEILYDITLSVPRGLVYGLVGPSGSGKTTLMRTVLGRQQIASGAVRVMGQPAGSPDLRARIGYMPQSAAVYEDLTARENLDFFATIYRVRPARVTEVLHLVGLHDISHRPVGTYSAGQRQRVSLAAAMLPAPSLLILDEPTVGLDPRLRRGLWARFAEWAAGGTTLLISTHVMDEAAHADRLAVLVDGALVAEGRPVDLLARSGAPDLEAAVLRLTDAITPEAVLHES